MRSLLFNAAFWVLSIYHLAMAAIGALRPGSGAVRRAIRRYVSSMTFAMRVLAGITIEVRGRERLPSGPFILAAKHASYGDGFSIYNEVDDLVLVAGDHLERFPLMKRVLTKLGAIMVNHCGGAAARDALNASASVASAKGQRILIYPEGHLAPVGVRYRYRSGVYHLAREFDLPVVPVASSLGWFWPQEKWGKRRGRAVLEFLDPIEAGESRRAFLANLEATVEARTAELIAEATGRPVTPAVRAVPPSERRRSRPQRPIKATADAA